MARKYSIGANLVANTKTTIYTVPAGYLASWSLCHISNHTGTNKTISLWWYDSSQNVEITVIDAYQLSPTQFIQFGGSGLYVALEAGDEIRMKSETGSNMSTINTFELERNNG